MIDEPTSNGQQTVRQRPAGSQASVDRAVGSVGSVLGMLVVLASILSPSRTGIVATTGVLLGVFGYLLGARILGAATILVSAAVILTWLVA
jgi:hypothetical protein